MAFLKDVGTDFMALAEPNEPSEAEWESDYHLLRTTASLMGTTPHALLNKISDETGNILSLCSLRTGQRLPTMSKTQLLRTFEEQMRIEEKAIENACRESQELASLILPLLLLFGVAVLLLV